MVPNKLQNLAANIKNGRFGSKLGVDVIPRWFSRYSMILLVGGRGDYHYLKQERHEKQCEIHDTMDGNNYLASVHTYSKKYR